MGGQAGSQAQRSMPIRLSAHARGYQQRRGFTEAEVMSVIRTAPWRTAQHNRLEATLDLPYNDMWNGSYYETKQVRPIFVVESTEIVVVTVYTYYF